MTRNQEWPAETVPVVDPEQKSGDERLDLLLDLELPVSISFGKTQVLLEELARLGRGAIVEFDRSVDDPVQVLVNDRVVAWGEVVVVNGNYGVRLQRVSTQRGSICTKSL